MIYLRVHNRYLNLGMHKHLLGVKHDKTPHKVVSFNTLPWCMIMHLMTSIGNIWSQFTNFAKKIKAKPCNIYSCYNCKT